MFSSEAWLANPSSGFYNGVATQSLRFDGSSRLEKNFSSDGSKQKWTISVWVKRSNIAVNLVILGYSSSSSLYGALYFHNHQIRIYDLQSSSLQFDLSTNALHRDPSAWYHIVVSADTTQSTASNRIKMYVNGVQVTSFATETYPDRNFNSLVTDDCPHMVGRYADEDNGSFKGYMSEFNLVDGTQLDPTSFGETKNGVWIPKKYTGSYGTNGFRLKFDQVGVGTASTSTIGADTSGNTHHFTSSGIVASDCNMPDSPENNFATLNPLINEPNSPTLSEGNLKSTSPNSSAWRTAYSHLITSNKWYWEIRVTAQGSLSKIGVVSEAENTSSANAQNFTKALWYNAEGTKRQGTSTTSYGASYGVGDIIGVALDMENNTISFYKNNASQGQLDLTSLNVGTDNLYVAIALTDASVVFNFGQDSSFSGTETAQGNTDANGIGDFYYAPPSGLALCTANLPEPTIGPNSDTQANDHFSSALFTGTSGDVDVAVPFKPDWVWIKARSDAQGHSLVDSSRGGTKLLQSNTDGLENSVNSGNDVNEIHFTVDGFTSNTDWHTNNYTYVSWNWKANGNTTSTIAVDSVSSGVPSIASTVQANTTAGFSIVTYSGNADASATIGHGLGKTPKLIFAKQRDEAGNWIGYNEVTGATNKLNLNQTTGSAESALWNDTAPTDKVFSVKDTSSEDTFGDGHTYVAYCFTDVEGYSKFGKYTGNGATSATNSDGTFAFLGFRPAFIMIKNTSASAEWVMIDSVRSTFNEVDKILSAEDTSTEADYVYANRNIDFLSNGFKIRNTQAGGSTALNTSNHIYFYMAFAEAPFKYANAR